jgi:cation transport ATPase
MIPKFYGSWVSSVVAALVVSTACALILAVR